MEDMEILTGHMYDKDMEIERLRAINAELKQAVDLMMNEIIASGNWNARDFGWPKAVAAAKAVQRHFVDEQKVSSDADK